MYARTKAALRDIPAFPCTSVFPPLDRLSSMKPLTVGKCCIMFSVKTSAISNTKYLLIKSNWSYFNAKQSYKMHNNQAFRGKNTKKWLLGSYFQSLINKITKLYEIDKLFLLWRSLSNARHENGWHEFQNALKT